MPKIDPFVKLFVAIVAALATFIVPVFLLLRADIADVRGEVAVVNERLTRIESGLEAVEAVQAEHGERLTRIESTQAEHGARLTGIETVQAEHGRRLTGIEAGLESVESAQAEHGARLVGIESGLESVRTAQAGLEAGQVAVRGDLSATNERLARVEGTVAGALARAFPERMAPERMAQAPEPEAGAGG